MTGVPPSRATPWWRAAFVAALVSALVLALGPATPPGQDWFDQADKLRHMAAFTVLWLLGSQARIGRALFLAVALLAFGVLIEGLQSLTPDRMPSFGDVLADAAGIALGAVIDHWLARRRGSMR